MNSEIVKRVERKGELLAAQPKRHTPLRQAAETLTRRNIAGAEAELLSEALWRAVQVLYEQDSSGSLCNVDPVSGRVLLPLPWGRMGHRRWGLRYLESVVLRAILRDFQQAASEPPLLIYDPLSRGWYLNFFDYASHRQALGWLERHPITASAWRSAYAVWQGSA